MLNVLQGVFFFSCIWSIGATLEADSRPKFDILFRGLLEKEFPDTVILLNYTFIFNLDRQC